MHAASNASFAFAQNVSGWLSLDQAHRLADAVRGLRPHAVVVEIGSHRGKSAIVMAGAREDVEVHAVDPFVESHGGPQIRAEFESNVQAAGVAARITLHAERSADALARWDGPVDLLYVDGKHDTFSCLRDLRWSRHAAPDAPVFVHDSFSSLGVTLAIVWVVLLRGTHRYEGRTGSLALLRRAPADRASRLRCLAEMPWWARNLLVKVLLRLRLRRVAALLGHTDTSDPY